MSRPPSRGAVWALVLAAGLWSGAACTRLQPQWDRGREAQLHWRIRQFRKTEGACGEPVGCARYTASWPELTWTGDPAVERRLNLAVLDLLAQEAAGSLDPLDVIAAQARDLMDGWREARERFPDAASTSEWSIEKRVEVLASRRGWISLAARTRSYTGGAHGMELRALRTLDLADGQPMSLEEALRGEPIDAFRRRAEAAFRREMALAPEADLEAAGFWFPGGVFGLPGNWALTETGILLLWNPYEIAPYARGSIQLHLDRGSAAHAAAGRTRHPSTRPLRVVCGDCRGMERFAGAC